MSLGLVPEGAVIERVYYAVPGGYGIGEEFTNFVDAREHAIAQWHLCKAAVIAGYPATWPDLEKIGEDAANPKCVVDLRWKIRFPHGGGTDAVIERTSVAHMVKTTREQRPG